MKTPAWAAIAVTLILAGACDAGSPDPPAVRPASTTARPALALPGSPAPAKPATPDRSLTPGSTFPGVGTDQVCTPGYSRRARLVLPEQYRAVYRSYGIPYPQPAGSYELDHLIPLELGGDNTDLNLWPEPAAPRPGFHEKDDLENILHDLVCSGRLDLAVAQSGMASDWVAMYARYRQP